MKIGNTDGLSRKERMATINSYSSFLNKNLEIVDKEVNDINTSTLNTIYTDTSNKKLIEREDESFPIVSNTLSSLLTTTNASNTTYYSQVVSTITLTSNVYYINLKNFSATSRDAIETTLLQQIQDLTNTGTPPTAEKQLDMYKTSYNTPTATSTAECKTFYYNTSVRTGLLVPWADVTNTALDDCYTLYKNYKILQALNVENNINIIGSHNNSASASIAMNLLGNIDEITLVNSGSNYLSNPEVIFLGGGGGTGAYASTNLTRSVTSITINNSGLGYAEPPLVVFSSGNAKAVTTIDLAGRVSSIIITDKGEGYTSVPTVQIVGISNTQATATIQIGNGRVSSVTLENGGTGFTSSPSVYFVGGGLDASISTDVTTPINDIEILNGGLGYATNPDVVPVALMVSGTAEVDSFGNGVIYSINITNGGTNYQEATTIIGITGSGSNATAEPVINNGIITGINMTNVGSGYSELDTVITATDSSGNGSNATFTANIKNGSISSINITSAGSNYKTVPKVYIYGTGIRATATAVLSGDLLDSITVTNGGYGYTGTPYISIEAGYGASATSTVTSGVVSDVTVLTKGNEYRFPKLSLSESPTNSADIILQVGIGNIIEAKILNGGSGYTNNVTISVAGSTSNNNAVLTPVVTNGVITSVSIVDGGRDYLYPELHMGKDSYIDYNLKVALNYSSSSNSTVASNLYYIEGLKTALGYPNATTLSDAEAQWISNYNIFLANNQQYIEMPKAQQDALFKYAYGYPNAQSVSFARNSYRKARLNSLNSGVNIEKPLSHPKNRRDMDIISQVGVRKPPVVEKKQNQFMEVTKKSQTTSIMTMSNDTRSSRMNQTNTIDNAINSNNKLIDKEVDEIKANVSFNYRYPDALTQLNQAVADANTLASTQAQAIQDANDTIDSDNADAIISESENEWITSLTYIENKTLAEYPTDALWTNIDYEVDSTVADAGSQFSVMANVKVYIINRDIESIRNQVKTQIYKNSIYKPTVNVIPPDFLGSGAVVNATIKTGGSGYTNANVSINGAGGSNATATVFINNSTTSISNIAITNPGSDYPENTAVTITGDGSGAFAKPVITNGVITAISVVSGSNCTRAEVIITEGGSGAKIIPLVNSGRIIDYTIVKGGKKYVSPVLSIKDIDGPGTGATGTINVTDGIITSITVTNLGSNYNNPELTITDGGTGATAVAIIDPATKTITGIDVTNGGSNYSNPVITIEGTGTLSTASATVTNGLVTDILLEQGVVTGFTVVNGGSGYFGTPPTITVTGLRGSGAVGTASVVNGVISSVSVSSRGSGYLVPPLSTAERLSMITNAYNYSIERFEEGKNMYLDGVPNIGIKFEGYAEDADTPYGFGLEAVPTGNQTLYYNYRVKNVLGYPNVANASSAINTYVSDNTKQVLGYPNAGSIAAAGVLAKESRKKAILGFPNAATKENAKYMYQSQYIDEALDYPDYIKTITVTNGGSNYKTAPNVEIIGGGSTEVVALATINSGAVNSVTYVSGGAGYGRASEVELIGGGGTGATVDLTVDIDTGLVTGFTNLVGGSGYTSPPLVIVKKLADPIAATAVANINHNGEVESVTVTSKGGYYALNPEVVFSGGGGSGATAVTNYIVPKTRVNSGTFYFRKLKDVNLGISQYVVSRESNVVNSKQVYMNMKLAERYGYVFSPTEEITNDLYKSRVVVQSLYNNATPTLANEIVPEEFGNRLDRELFPNDSNYQAARLLKLYQQMEIYKTQIPPSQTQVSIDQLYKTAYGYSATDTIVFQGTSYKSDPNVVITRTSEVEEGRGDAAAVPEVVNSVITDVHIIQQGEQYNSIPTVSFSGQGNGATVTATLDGNFRVSNITINSGGVGYLGAPYLQVVGGKNLVDAQAIATMVDGKITNIQLKNPSSGGTGYTNPPIVSLIGKTKTVGYVSAIVTASVNAGVVTGFTISNQGTGYKETPIVFIRRADNANIIPYIQNGKVVDLIMVSAGSNYDYDPELYFYPNPNERGGRGARAKLKRNNDGTISFNIPVSDAEEGYRIRRSEELYDNQFESRLPLANIRNGGSTNMNIGMQSYTHYERVYGKTPTPTDTDVTFMTLLKDVSSVSLRERIVPTNMSISQASSVMTRRQRLDRSNTYLTLYRQAEAIVKAKVIRDSSHTQYTPEQQKAMLYQELAKIKGKPPIVSDKSTDVIIGEAFGTIVENNKRFVNLSKMSHEDRLEYNSQRSVVQNNINNLIAKLERNRGGEIVATITKNGGINYISPLVIDISAPDMNITSYATATATVNIVDGSITSLTLTNPGEGYSVIPPVVITGDGTGAKAVAILSGTSITGFTITSIGKNYTSATVTIPGVVVQATATAMLYHGSVGEITITNKGWGYENVSVSVNASNQTGSGATFTTVIKDGSVDEIYINNEINTLTVTDPGRMFDYPPELVFSSGDAEATVTLNANKTLNSNVTIVNRGSRYITAPTVKLVVSQEERESLEKKYWYDRPLEEDLPVDGVAFGEIKRITNLKKMMRNSQLYKDVVEARIDSLRGYQVLSNTPNPVTALISACTCYNVVQSIDIDRVGTGYLREELTTENGKITVTGNGSGLKLKAMPNPDGTLTFVEVVNGCIGYGFISIAIAPPDTKNNFDRIYQKALLLTNELKKANGIKLENPLTGAGDMISTSVEPRKTRF